MYANVLHVHPLCFSPPGELCRGHCSGHGFWGPHGTYRRHSSQALSTDQMALHRAPVDHRKVTLPKLTFISHLSPANLWLHSPLTSGTLIGLLTLSALHLERPTRGLKFKWETMLFAWYSPNAYCLLFTHLNRLDYKTVFVFKALDLNRLVGVWGGHLLCIPNVFAFAGVHIIFVNFVHDFVYLSEMINLWISTSTVISNLWNY